MFRSVLDVPDDGREVGQLVNNVVDDVNHTLIGVVLVCGENEGWGRDWDVVDCWFLIFMGERRACCVCVCACVGVNAMERKP